MKKQLAKVVLGALACASLVIPTGMAFAANDASSDANATYEVSSGSLDWGVRESFRKYLTGAIAKGSVETTDGASTNEDGTYKFSATGGSYDANANTGTVNYKGTVHFTGHSGLLDLTFSNPTLKITSSTTADLMMDVKSKALGASEVTDYGNVKLADVTLSSAAISAQTLTVTASKVTLAKDGVQPFANFYSEGTQLDNLTSSLSVTLKASETATVTPTATSSETPSATSEATESTTSEATPSITVSEAPYQGGSVTVTGKNFSIDSPGIYVAWTVNPAQGATLYSLGREALSGAVAVYPPTDSAEAGKNYFNQDGSFSVELSGLPAYAEGQTVVVMTSKAHGQGLTDTSQNTQAVVSYAAAAVETTTAQPSETTTTATSKWPAEAGDTSKVELSATQVTDGKVTVTGKNFPTTAPGIYIALVPASAPSFYEYFTEPDSSAYNVFWVATSITADAPENHMLRMDENGNFTATFTLLNTTDEWKVITSRAHGVGKTDPSLDFSLPISYTQSTSINATVTDLDESAGNTSSSADQTTSGSTSAATETNEGSKLSTTLKINSGSLLWGVRKSFTTYIRGSIANGDWTTSNGVTWTGSQFSFPVSSGTYDRATKSGTVSYSGTIHFTGHNGILDLTLSNPRLVISGSSAKLYLTVSSSDTSGNKTNYGEVYFADVTLSKVNASDNSLSLASSSVNLTATGAKAFAGFYSTGEQMDNLSSELSGSLLTQAEASVLAKTGAELNNALLIAGILSALGAAVLVVGRQRKESLR